MNQRRKSLIKPVSMVVIGMLLLLFGCLLFSKEVGAARRYDSSAVAGIAFDVENYIDKLSDDELGISVDVSQVLGESSVPEESYPE